jgi:hypothetical protein
MSKTRRLFLHAGTHKTGTTSIQAMLRDAGETIAHAGIKVVLDLPGATMMPTNCNAVSHAFIRDTVFSPTRINKRIAPRFGEAETIRHLMTQLADSRFETLLMSSECFCYMRTRTERKHLERHLAGFELRPFLYFRNDAGWRKSWDSQMAKEPYVTTFRRRFPEKFDFDDWYFDRDAIVSFWRGVSTDAVFLDYDKEVAEKGSVIPSFLDFVGLPQSLAGDYFLNRSP